VHGRVVDLVSQAVICVNASGGAPQDAVFLRAFAAHEIHIV